eukprot:4270703-Pleurochrysis_carterae.AAC.1
MKQQSEERARQQQSMQMLPPPAAFLPAGMYGHFGFPLPTPPGYCPYPTSFPSTHYNPPPGYPPLQMPGYPMPAYPMPYPPPSAGAASSAAPIPQHNTA